MLNWINPRVVVVVISVLGTLEVTQAKSFDEVVRRAIIICALMILLYVLSFVLPLRKAVKAASLFGLIFLLVAAWGSTGIALIADAMPVPPEKLLEHPWNWPRTAFVVAAGLSFYLFFDHASKGFAVRRQMQATGQAPWKPVEHKEEAVAEDAIEAEKEVAAKP